MRHELVESHIIAERQGGVIAHRQLRACGVSTEAIARRVRSRRLHPVHRGVYAVGHRLLGASGRRWAAVLACGDGAVVSHSTAADAFDLLRSDSPTVHVSVGPGGRARRAGVRVHRTVALAPDEIMKLDGLPITTPSRTLLDLAATRLPRDALATAVDRADVLKLVDFAELRELLARYPRRPGTASLNAMLARYRGHVDTRSELERLVHKLCDERGLPSPSVNCSIEGKVRDFYWPHRRLVVEADSYGWHRSPSALNTDRERDVELELAVCRVHRA